MLSAVHTYMHMWSPIFCEVGLQCLLSTTPLLKFFLEQFTSEDCTKDSLTTYFYQLVRKIWSGQFSIVYPRDFKNALGLFHVQFQDYRQVCFFFTEILGWNYFYWWSIFTCDKIIWLRSHNVAVINFPLSVYRSIDHDGNNVKRLEVLSNNIMSF